VGRGFEEGRKTGRARDQGDHERRKEVVVGEASDKSAFCFAAGAPEDEWKRRSIRSASAESIFFTAIKGFAA
jgi:hypothetical protein